MNIKYFENKSSLKENPKKEIKRIHYFLKDNQKLNYLNHKNRIPLMEDDYEN